MRLRRILLDSVGHPDARFDPLLLDLRGTSAQALDTVLWLRNAGGKTSLLSLVFSVLQPNRNQFLGYLQKGRAKSIDKYILPDDVAHVVLEWEEEGLPGFGAPFVTATVMALRSEGGGEDRLSRFWYAFRPAEGTFGLDELPIREGGRRTPYRRYCALLEELAGRHAATELVIRDHQAEWLDYLDRNQIDPEMFRYQLSMNRDEGGAVKLLEGFSDADSFVDFLVDVVSDPADAAEVLQNLVQVAGKIEMRPKRERERAFVAGTIERLRPLAGAHAAWRTAREEHQQVVLDGSRLRRRIAQAAAAAEELAEQQAAEAAGKKQEYDVAERLRSQLDRQANTLELERLRFEVAELERAVAGAREVEAEAKRLARAWEASEIVAELNEVEATAERLRAELAREIEDAADLRREYEQAAMRLRGHLAGLAAAARSAAERAHGMAESSEIRRSREAAVEMAASNRVAEIGIELHQLDDRIHELAGQLAALAGDGLIERGETAAAALVRLRGQDLRAQTRLRAIPDERDGSERRRADAAGEVARLAERMADLRGRHVRLRQDRDHLLERATGLGEDERVVELLGHGNLDVLAAGHALSERLIDVIADAEHVLVEIQVEALEDRRALAAIEQTSLLPAAVSIEQAVARLRDEKLSATTGWQHLAQNVHRDSWPLILTTSPHLLDAVVVHPGRLERAAEVLGRETFPALTGSLTVVESTEFDTEPAPGRRLWTLPPAPARYEAGAAAEERGRRETRVGAADLRLNEVTGQRDADHGLLLRLRQLLDECPPGRMEGLAHELRQQAAELAELDARRAEQEDVAGRAGDRLGDLAEEERRLHAERLGLEAATGRVRPIVAAEDQRPAWLERQTALVDERRLRLEERDRAQEAKDEAQADARRRMEDANQARNDARTWLREVEQLPHFDVEVDAAEAGLDALRVAYQALRDQYERRTTKSELARRADAESDRAGRVRARLQLSDVEVVALARELLAEPGASSPGFRAERVERARLDQETATGGRITADGEAKRARGDLERLSAGTRNLTTLPDALRPVDRAHAARLFEEVSTRMASERARRDAAETDQRAAEGRARDAAHEHDLLASEERHLALTLGEEGVESQATYGPIGADEARQGVARIVGALQSAASELADLEERRRQAANRLRQFAGSSEYDELEGPYRERLTDPDDRALAARAEGDLEELERRLPFLDHQLAEIERHQARVAEQLLVQVDDALQNLRWLQRQEMPDGLGEWSGQHYFHIRYDLPETHDERKLRIQVLLDEVVAARLKLRGTDLVQRALRRVNRRPCFEVDVLKPNEGLRPERAGVAEIGAWSGGQKLTTAILIYCALARLRADNRSQQRSSPVGVLLLDNPIGTANLSALIDLQRLVAEKFGVQLVYTTGIDDKPALAPFTNVIRLGNRRERRRERGHIVVEDAEDGALSVVEAARVFRRGTLGPR
jgi:hypothetical protein